MYFLILNCYKLTVAKILSHSIYYLWWFAPVCLSNLPEGMRYCLNRTPSIGLPLPEFFVRLKIKLNCIYGICAAKWSVYYVAVRDEHSARCLRSAKRTLTLKKEDTWRIKHYWPRANLAPFDRPRSGSLIEISAQQMVINCEFMLIPQIRLLRD